MLRLFPKSYHELNLLMLWFFKCMVRRYCFKTFLSNTQKFGQSVFEMELKEYFFGWVMSK